MRKAVIGKTRGKALESAFVTLPKSTRSTNKRRVLGCMQYFRSGNQVTINNITGNLLDEGQRLSSCDSSNCLIQRISGSKGPYYQAIVQRDGNFVVYYCESAKVRKPVFAVDQGGKGDIDWYITPQRDGNLVLYSSTTGKPTWASKTHDIQLDNAMVGLCMQQDGNLVLYAFYDDGTCDPIWATHNTSPNGRRVWPHD